MANILFAGTARFVTTAVLDEFDNAPTMFYKKIGIRGHIINISGLLPTSVVWEKDPRPMVSDIDNVLLLMNLKSSDFIGGSDDKRLSIDPATGKYTYELTGPRSLRLTIKAESYNRQIEAYEVLERIRTLLNGNFELDNIGMCYQTAKLISDLPTSYDNRVVNVAVLELQLGLVSSVIARVPGDPDGKRQWIKTVNTDNTIPGEYT